jgi:hypothetical protein
VYEDRRWVEVAQDCVCDWCLTVFKLWVVVPENRLISETGLGIGGEWKWLRIVSAGALWCFNSVETLGCGAREQVN